MTAKGGVFVQADSQVEELKAEIEKLKTESIQFAFDAGKTTGDIVKNYEAELARLRERLAKVVDELERLADAVAPLEGEPIRYQLAIPLGVALVAARQVIAAAHKSKTRPFANLRAKMSPEAREEVRIRVEKLLSNTAGNQEPHDYTVMEVAAAAQPEEESRG